MRRLSSQRVWPGVVIDVFDAGAECDITIRAVDFASDQNLSLTRAQARRLANALLKFAKESP